MARFLVFFVASLALVFAEKDELEEIAKNILSGYGILIIMILFYYKLD
jgi:hypothetical protein